MTRAVFHDCDDGDAGDAGDASRAGRVASTGSAGSTGLTGAVRRILAAVSLLLPLAASAQIYVCKDASGRTLTSDRLIPECANRAMRELDRSGLVRREIAAPLTALQKQEREAQQERQRLDAAALDEQRLYDRAMMIRYRNETDIASARQRALDLLGDQMRIDTNALTQEAKELKAAQAHAVPGVKKTGSPAERRLEEATNAMESRLNAIEQRTADIARTNTKFDQALKRFRELAVASGTASNQR